MVPRVIHGEAIVTPAFVILASTRGCVLVFTALAVVQRLLSGYATESSKNRSNFMVL